MKLFLAFLANRLAVVMVRICQMRMQTACKLKRPISFFGLYANINLYGNIT